MSITVKSLHRDLGYFYIGLIVAFAFSGIMMNHRNSWHPDRYTVETKQIQVKLPLSKEISEDDANRIAKELGLKDKVRRHKVKKDELNISLEKNDIEIDLKTGKGELITYQKTPIISHTMKLHKSPSEWWIYYSDIFGISLIVIAITGALIIPKGKFSFKHRGWKLAALGIVFPILFLILFA